MKNLSMQLRVCRGALGLALTALSGLARSRRAGAAEAASSAAAIAAAKEILTMKNAARCIRRGAQRSFSDVKDALVQSNLNYQKDLNEVALIVAQNWPAAKTKSARAWRRSTPPTSPSRS